MFVVDAAKALLLNAMRYKPFLVKPNNHELGEIFNVTLKTREDVVPYAKKLFGLMGLGVKQGMEITVQTEGDDEEAASAALDKFLHENL